MLLIVTAVSIHVPAKGTTFQFLSGIFNFTVSIHVPAKGTTVFADKMLLDDEGFNPRSREGNDIIDNFYPMTTEIVSIHVPAKGTTS